MTTHIQVITTVAEKEQAQSIARRLLDKQLAACVQIETCESMYRWKGGVEQDREYRCTIKTRYDFYSKVEEELTALHPYEVPEIIAVPVINGAASYLEWLDHELKVQKQR